MNYGDSKRLCGFIESLVGPKVVRGSVGLKRGNRWQIDEYSSHKPSSEISDKSKNLNV